MRGKIWQEHGRKPNISSGGCFNSLLSIISSKVQVVDTIALRSHASPLNANFLKSKYVEEGFSSHEIAQISFSSRSTITQRLKGYGIGLNSSTRRTNGSHVFGFKKLHGKCVPMEKEQRIIREIKKYRNLGHSYQKIADILNNERIATKTRKARWYPKVIRQIHLRSV